jgi:hypothetical protein
MNSITINEVRNAKALNQEETIFDVEINHPEHGWIPYTLNPEDTDNTIDNNQLLLLIGNDYKSYVAPTEQELYDAAVASILGVRAYTLETLVDPVISNSIRFDSMNENDRNDVLTFRQEWLDITDHVDYPFLEAADLPTVPSVLDLS